jgi:hypothetical protein
MQESKDRLEQELQKPRRHFCYPWGDHDGATREMAQEIGFASAVTTDFGRVRAGDDPLRLPRVSVYHIPYLSVTYGPRAMNFWWRVRSRKDTRTPDRVSPA